MKNHLLIITIVSLSFPVMAEDSWLDSLKSFVGLSKTKDKVEQQTTSSALNTSDMVSLLTDSLSVKPSQAAGGLGSLFNLVKNNVSSEQFSQLGKALPGVDSLINQMPDISQLTSSGGMSSLLDKASQYNDSLKSINDVSKQFEALGLSPEMITDFVNTAQGYLNTEQGKQAKDIFTQGLGKLLG
jgi:hypothetical protein